MALALAVPAFAIEESEVEAAVNATSREEVTGNVLIWFLCAVAFLKVSQKIDSFMSSIGVNVGHTGGSMLAEAMVAARGISVATGATGISVWTAFTTHISLFPLLAIKHRCPQDGSAFWSMRAMGSTWICF